MQKTKNVMKGLTAKEEEIMGFFWEKAAIFRKYNIKVITLS